MEVHLVEISNIFTYRCNASDIYTLMVYTVGNIICYHFSEWCIYFFHIMDQQLLKQGIRVDTRNTGKFFNGVLL